jgi:hypothetical protein
MKTIGHKNLNNCAQAKGRLAQLALVALLLVLTQFLTGCLLDPSKGEEAGTAVVTQPGPVTDPLTTPERTICDPFSTKSPSAQDRGVVASMVWLDERMPPVNGQPSLAHVSDYLAIGNPVQSTLYFDRIFVPTRAFDLGFTTLAGQPVLNYLGQPLYEYFALHMEGQLQLAPDEAPGLYQLTVISDDGSVLKVSDGNGGWTTIVDNDGNHSTRMACSVQTVNMQRDTKLPFTLDYYQGPRYHISVAMMWRPVPDGTNPDVPVVDPRCGQSGNSLFWDSTKVPSVAKAPFYDILSRGWKVLENENYFFPAQATNPCAPAPAEETLYISAFRVNTVSRSAATITWTTTIPATSQIEYQATTAGSVKVATAVDSNLVTSHTVTLTGLSPNTLYSLRGLSTSPAGQSAISDEAAFRTAR